MLRVVISIFFVVNIYIAFLIYKNYNTLHIVYKLDKNSSNLSIDKEKIVKECIKEALATWFDKSKNICPKDKKNRVKNYIDKSFLDTTLIVRKNKEHINIINVKNPYKVLQFVFKGSQIVDISYKDIEFKKEQFFKLLKAIENAQDDYDILNALLEIKALSSKISSNYYDSSKTYSYLAKEIDKLSTKATKEKIAKFAKEYPKLYNILDYKKFELGNKAHFEAACYRVVKDKNITKNYKSLLNKLLALSKDYKLNKQFIRKYGLKKDTAFGCNRGIGKYC